jgi:hypothetical protein
MRDRELRFAAKASFLAPFLSDPDVLVIEELGLRHGAGRVDIAVVNGELHGYELKSDQDTLKRLPQQIAIYGSVLDRVSLVVTSEHLLQAEKLIPCWWEILLADRAIEGSVTFKVVRMGSANQNVSASEVLKLLWREEALAILTELQAVNGMKSKPRKVIYNRIHELIELSDIQDRVRRALKTRKCWRSDEQ